MIKVFKSFLKKDFLFKFILLFGFLALVLFFNLNFKEGFSPQTYTVFNDEYNNNYASFHDSYILNDNEEVFKKINKYLTDDARVIDVGSGTGKFVDLLNKNSYNTAGVDKSKELIDYSKSKYPNYKFIHADINDNMLSLDTKYTHSVCLDNIIYNMNNGEKKQFFNNMHHLLEPDGYIFLNLIDIDKYNPIHNNSKNSKMLKDIYDLEMKNITNSITEFGDIIYKRDYKVYPNDFKSPAQAVFKETIEKDGSVVEYITNLELLPQDEILKFAKDSNFKFVDKLDFDNEYIYVLQK